MATEVELKLLVDSADIVKLRRHPLLKRHAGAGPQRQRLVSIYFDTPDLALKARRVALRVRRSGSNWVQTVKDAGEARAGLHQRGEWECPVAHGHPDLTKIVEPALVRIFSSDEVQGALQPVFTTEFHRTVWLLTWDDGDEVELALDQGEVKSGERALPLCEVELELKRGRPARLFEIALELQQRVPLRLENASKAERGYHLFGGTRSVPTKAVSPRIGAAMRVEEAFLAIAWNCLAHWTANQTGVLEGGDPEYVHQMRVALRRLRSAIPLFASAIPRERTAAIAEDLKWLANQLGPARNWDVFATETLPPILAQFPGHAGLAQLRQAAATARTTANEAASQALRSPRYQRLLLTLGHWLASEAWRGETDTPPALRLQDPVTDLARRMLSKRYKAVHRHGAMLAEMAPAERHEVRIAAKKLRYAMEFFSALFSPKESSSFLKAMSALQDELGALNDVATTHQLLSELPAQDAEAAGIVAGWSARGVSMHLAHLDTVWDSFRRCRVFWR